MQGPPEGPPKLEWSQLGFTSDHHVGSAPAAHFGLRVRNKGGGELQLSIFINAASARFYVPRPRDLTLLAGAPRAPTRARNLPATCGTVPPQPAALLRAVPAATQQRCLVQRFSPCC